MGWFVAVCGLGFAGSIPLFGRYFPGTPVSSCLYKQQMFGHQIVWPPKTPPPILVLECCLCNDNGKYQNISADRISVMCT